MIDPAVTDRVAGPKPDQVADVIVCPGGPVLLRGQHVVQAVDGTPHATTRPVTALCRCGASATAPWCDGTHKELRHPPLDKPPTKPA